MTANVNVSKDPDLDLDPYQYNIELTQGYSGGRKSSCLPSFWQWDPAAGQRIWAWMERWLGFTEKRTLLKSGFAAANPLPCEYCPCEYCPLEGLF